MQCFDCDRLCIEDEIAVAADGTVYHTVCESDELYRAEKLLHCPLCTRLCRPSEVQLNQHGEQVHADCGCVLLDRDVGIDFTVHHGAADAAPLDGAIHNGDKRKKRTPPIRARPTRGRGMYRLPTLRSSNGGGYERPYHLNERLSQRQNIEVPYRQCHSSPV